MTVPVSLAFTVMIGIWSSRSIYLSTVLFTDSLPYFSLRLSIRNMLSPDPWVFFLDFLEWETKEEWRIQMGN